MTLPEDPQDMIAGDPVQRAVARRLAKLRGLPVDTSRLERVMQGQLPRPALARRRWLAQLGAAAASVILIAFLAVLTLQGRPAQASPALMAQMHHDIVSGKIPTMKADTIEEANQAIAAMAGNSLRLPASPSAHTMACCMRSIGNKQVACVLLKSEGVPVTMTAAKAADVAPPAGPVSEFHGVSYHVQSVGGLHMVSFAHQDIWICLVADAPAQTLMGLADQLRHQ